MSAAYCRAADDDPLAGMPQSPLDPVLSRGEEKIRQHLTEFLLVLIDDTADRDDRENALRHLVVCDPARALGALAQWLPATLSALEAILGDPPGTALADFRAALRKARTSTREGVPQ